MARKTTIYLPEDLKADVERAARQQAVSEAQVIRDAIAQAVAAPRPTAGLLDAEPFAAQAEEHLAGFGER